jgi:hypothetical protein
VQTCKLDAGDPQRFLGELLDRGCPQSHIDQLMLSDAWRKRAPNDRQGLATKAAENRILRTGGGRRWS